MLYYTFLFQSDDYVNDIDSYINALQDERMSKRGDEFLSNCLLPCLQMRGKLDTCLYIYESCRQQYISGKK